MVNIGQCGYDRHEQDGLTIHRPNGSGDYLLLLLLTPFTVTFPDRQDTTEPYAMVIYTPEAYQHYRPVEAFKNSYFHFTTDTDFNTAYGIPLNTVIYPYDHLLINQLIRDIVLESIKKSLHFERKIECLFEQIMIELSRGLFQKNMPEGRTTLFLKFQNIRITLIMFCESDWTTEKICKLANMEKSQLYKNYSLFFNTTPKSDVINARLEKAKYLLTNEDLLVYQVAEMSGFKNISHFTRYFKRSTGCAPSEYNGKPRPLISQGVE